ncbi:hypothetical protein NKG05_00570 [Oerskovia sp. M15]
MTRSVDEANGALSRVRDMPYGTARSTAAASEVDEITADGPAEARAYALFILVESYVWGNEVTKAYLPFTQLLRWWDEHPEHFDAQDTHSLFWSFKWMVGNLMDFPAVPAAQIERTLDDMERRFAVAGSGMNAVAMSRFQWERARARGTRRPPTRPGSPHRATTTPSARRVSRATVRPISSAPVAPTKECASWNGCSPALPSAPRNRATCCPGSSWPTSSRAGRTPLRRPTAAVCVTSTTAWR